MKLLKVIAITTFFLVLPNHVQAEEGSMPYSINLLPSDKQIDQSGYYNLEASPGETITLEVEIENPGDEPVTINTSINDALTADQAFITYDGNGTRSETMDHPFSELTATEDEVIEVAPDTKEIAIFEVQMPEESFDGVILGGLHFINEGEGSEEAEIQIDNLFAYEVAVQIREADNEKPVEPEFSWKGASAQTYNHREAIMAGISNDASLVAGDTRVTAQVTQNGDTVLETEIEDAVFAPDSLMEWPIYTADANLQAGDYGIEVTLERGEEEWTFEDTFSITEEEREQIDETAIADVEENEDENGMNWLIIGLIGAVVLLVAIVLLLLLRMRRQGRD